MLRLDRLACTRPLLVGAALTVLLTALLPASPAQACGGFFCSQAAPVVQTDEQIIFVDHGNGEVTAVVRLFYRGDAEDFAWVVPVPGEPEIGISSNAAFNALDVATQPQFSITRRVEGACGPSAGSGCGCAGEALTDISGDGGTYIDNGDFGVLAAGEVGPYDYTLLSVSQNAADPAQDALEWLSENEYDVGSTDAELLRPYLDEGMNLLAFKLQKDLTAGEVRPVTMRYQTERPMVPIKLTAVAAQPGMGVLTYVVGPARAVPQNYRAIEPNVAKINWFTYAFDRSEYRELIDDAADEADGHGFVTEYAKPANVRRDTVFNETHAAVWSDLQGVTDPVVMWQDAVGGFQQLNANGFAFAPWDGFVEAAVQAYGLDATAAQNIVQCPMCEPELTRSVDAAALRDTLDTYVVAPMRNTQALLLENETLTRLFTTLSAEEMTVDPVFTYNASRPDVDQRHTAEQVVECHLGVSEFEAPYRVEFDDGTVLRGAGRSAWPDTNAMPANRRILRENETTAPDVVVDNIALIEEIAVTVPSFGSGTGCTGRQYGSFVEGGFLLFLCAGGNLALRRRRRASLER